MCAVVAEYSNVERRRKLSCFSWLFLHPV